MKQFPAEKRFGRMNGLGAASVYLAGPRCDGRPATVYLSAHDAADVTVSRWLTAGSGKSRCKVITVTTGDGQKIELTIFAPRKEKAVRS